MNEGRPGGRSLGEAFGLPLVAKLTWTPNAFQQLAPAVA